jgi:amidohydrolase
MSDTLAAVFSAVDAINERIITIRHDLHAHPELSGVEEHTKYLIKGTLEAEGLGIREFDDNHGIIADLVTRPGGPFVALRADIDALPITERTNAPYASRSQGIMHACGHDSHTAILLGTAIALSHAKAHLDANIRFIFQPSEEIVEGGSSDMIRHGCLENVKAIFGLHAYPYLNTGQIGYKHGVMLASADMFEIEIFGKSSHGARPHEGVDAILVTSMVVNSLNHIVSRQIDPIHPAVISLGTIEGGKAANVICDHVRLDGTVRTVNHDIRHKIPKMMEVSIEGICKSMHAQYKFHYDFGSPEVDNTPAMTDLLVEAASDIIGAENCIDLIDPVMGGEDFGRYLEVVPGAFFRLGTCNPDKGTCVSQHNARFDVDDDALIYGMKIMAAAALKAFDDA